MPSVRSLFAVLALTMPWLNPFAIGPWPAAGPWLMSLACWAAWLIVKPARPGLLAECGANAWLAAALVSAGFGLLQYFGAAEAYSPWVNKVGPGEAFANLRQRNQFASLTSIGLAVVLFWAATRWKSRASQWLAAALLAVACAASSSRTGMVQLLLLALLAGVWGGWRQTAARQLLVVVALAYGAAILALPLIAGLDPEAIGLLARLRNGDAACSSRLTLWSNVLHLITQMPWLGWGWGELDYAHFMTLYAGPRFCDILDNAHNLPLHLAVELGVPVAVAACGLGVWLLLRVRPWHETHPTRQMAWAVLAVILLHSMLEYPLWYGPFQIATALSIWILWVTPRQPVAGLSADTARSPADTFSVQNTYAAKVMVTSVAMVLLLGAAYAAWDYRRVSQIYLATSERAPAYRDNTFEKVRDSILFARQVRFAELTTTDLQPANAAYLNAMAHDLLHFSPEARVVEKLIESAVMLGRDDEALVFLARFRAAFPVEHARWVRENAMPAGASTGGSKP